MFQRFHDTKTQETDIIQENGSRSSTPGTAIDGRTMYTCNVSPMTAHDSLVSSYSTSISPAQSIITQNTQLICEDNQVIHIPKYAGGTVGTSPPEAHRYVVEVYRSPNDVADSSKYLDEADRMSIDVFRDSQLDPQRGVPLEMQRIRLEDHTSPDPYRRSVDSYPIDLQRVPEYALVEQVTADQQRLESEISRLHSELVRNGAVPRIMQADEIELNGFANTHTLDYRIVTADDCGEGSPPRMIQDTSRGTIADPQRLLQESILKDYYGGSQQRHHAELVRISCDPRTIAGPDNVRYASPESVRGAQPRFDLDMTTQGVGATLMGENLRLGSETPHSMISENLSVTPDGGSMVPENLCVTDPQHVLSSDNLRLAANGLSPDASGDGQMVGQTVSIADQSITIRGHYDTAQINGDHTHTYRDDQIRVQSPQYTDAYRGNMYSGGIHPGPPTPAPSVPPIVPDSSQTPISSRYYSGDQYIAAGGHSSQQQHTIAYANQFNGYGAAGDLPPAEKDYRHSVLTIEERIDRGYEDVKPFAQDYPVALPVMHLAAPEALPPPSIPKLPKPKKPKEAKPVRAPIVHRCLECERHFKNSTQLKNHMWRHTGEKPFTCEECGSKFTQQGNLRAHRRIHTGERPYQCNDCQSCFTQLSTLKTHQKIHSNERPYQCGHCDAAFRQIANLKTHQVTHTGERPHQCDQCDKAFTQKSNLKAHKNRVHCPAGSTGPHRRGRRKVPAAAVRPYACIECAAQFSAVANLKSHMKLHSGERCYECDHCGAGFTQRSNLKTHTQRMHGRGTIGQQGKRRVRCDQCPAMFRLKRCLKAHRKKRHAGKHSNAVTLEQSSGQQPSDDQSGDDYGSEADTIDGYYSDGEAPPPTALRSKMPEDFRRKTVGPEDRKTVYDPPTTPRGKLEPELGSQFEYPGSPVPDDDRAPVRVKMESDPVEEHHDNQNTVC